MPVDLTRNYGPSTSQSSTGEAIGHAEDYSEIIVNIDPNQTLYLSRFGKLKNAKELDWSWTTEGLRPPQENAHLEKMEYTYHKVGSLRMLHNFQQHVYESGYITDAQIRTDKIYKPDDLAREKMNAFTNTAKDMEFALINNKIARAESGDNPALTGGIQFFMQKEEKAVTVATTGVVTTTEAHNLKTGDFLYFDAATMPEGMKANIEYYVRVLSDTTFQLYDTMEGAIKEIAEEKVTPASTGSNVKAVLNNVYDLGGANDFELDDVNHVLEMIKKRGGNATEAFMSTSKFNRFNKLVNALAVTNRKSGEQKMDMVVTTYVGPNGVVNAQAHPMYGDKRIDILDMQYWDMKYFDPIHAVKDLPKTGTYEPFALEGWFGLQATQPYASGSIVGIPR